MKTKIFSQKIILGFSLGLSALSQAQTYNFYFDNDKATPANPTNNMQIPPPAEQEEVVAPAAPAPVATPVPAVPEVMNAPQYNYSARVRPDYQEAERIRKWSAGVSMSAFADSYQSSQGITASIGYHPLSYIGFRGFGGFSAAGGQLGVELDVTPIKITLFGFDNLIELGVMLGGSTNAAAYDNIMSMHLGGRVALNLHDNKWSLYTLARGNAGFATVELGVNFKF